MPTKRTLRTRGWRPDLSAYQVAELLTGELDYPVRGYTGYGDGTGKDLAAFITNEMRHDWAQHCDELLRFWISGASSLELPNHLPWLFFVADGPGTRPWGWWNLEDHPETEDEYLTRNGLWLPGERAAFEAVAEVCA